MDAQPARAKYRRRTLIIGLWILLFSAALCLRLMPRLGQQDSTQLFSRYLRDAVDERPAQVSRAIVRLASTPDERLFAEEAVRLADHEVDVAFASALRAAVQYPAPLTPEGKAISDRVAKVLSQVNADQDRVDAITKQLDRAPAPDKRALQSQLDLARAQLELDQDELDDAKQDLARSGSDVVARVQRQLDHHNLIHQQGIDTITPGTTGSGAEAGYDANNLISQIGAYYALSRKTIPLLRAREDTSSQLMRLMLRHDELERVYAAHRSQPTPSPAPGMQTDSARKAVQAAELASVREQAYDQRALSDLAKRVEDEQGLADVYGNWFSFLRSRENVALRGMIRSLLWILLIIPAAYFAGGGAERLLARLSRKHPRAADFRVLIRFVGQALGVLLILAVIFGIPAQLPAAIFGIVGAGLTVGLKDLAGVFVESRLRALVSSSTKAPAPNP